MTDHSRILLSYLSQLGATTLKDIAGKLETLELAEIANPKDIHEQYSIFAESVEDAIDDLKTTNVKLIENTLNFQWREK